MTKINGNRYCKTCGNKMNKKGFTSAGTQRWKCPICNKSSV